MLTHNTDTRNGWVNGTRCRLLATHSWTGTPKKLQQGIKGWGAQEVQLQNDTKYHEFNVKVIKDEENTLAKKIRFDDADVGIIPVRTDTSYVGGRHKQWKQVQAIPAYSLTDHKAQGLTLALVYIGLTKVFGFGIMYRADIIFTD